MPALYIREEGGAGESWCLWPEADATPGCIQETRSYIIDLRDVEDANSVELSIDDAPVQALRSPNATTGRWRWCPGFYAGSIVMRLDFGGSRSVELNIQTSPDLAKLSRADFDLMVQDVLTDTAALFSMSSFRTGIAKGAAGRAVPLARLEFIRSRVEELEAVTKAIDARPVRSLRAIEEVVPLHKAKALTGPEIVKSLRTGRLAKAQPGQACLPPVMQGYFPSRLVQRRKSDGVDNREHRAIKAAIRQWASWLNVVADTLRSVGQEDTEAMRLQQRWAVRCRGLARRLWRLLELPLFMEVADVSCPVVITPVFRQVPSYRRFFGLCRDMNTALGNVFGDFLNMPLARTFEIYELWCYLRLLRAAADLFGLTELDAGSLFQYDTSTASVYLPAGTSDVPLKTGWSLAFKRTYREFWTERGRRGSFSRWMVPDLTITCGDGGDDPVRLIVLDAKYRIETQLNDAISSIHMYRDAIVEAHGDGIKRIVVAAYLLSPHTPVHAATFEGSSMPGRLFHPAYRSTFKFGAVQLRPGMSLAEIRSAFEAILTDAGVMPAVVEAAL